MDLKYSSVALFVKDIQVSKDFYTNILRLEVDMDFGGNVVFKNGFAIWEIRGDHIIPSTLGIENIRNTSSNHFELYFETDDILSVYQALKVRDVKFVHEVHEEPWGQQTIRFFDPDKHLIEVGESMEQFVRRFYDMGLSIKQVSERTSVPVEKVRRLIK